MIPHRKLSCKSTKFKPSNMGRYDEQGQNKPIIQQFQGHILSLPLRKRSSRPQLGEITNHLNQNSNSSFLFCKNTRTASSYTKRSVARSLVRCTQTNTKKVNEGQQDQQIQLVGCPEEVKELKRLLERPRTSVSHYAANEDLLAKKGQVFLEQFKENTNTTGQRISTSRALSKYSTVQKNTSVSRFKVKRDRNMAPVYLASRRIVLQAKEKKDNSYAQKFKDNMLGLRKQSRNLPFGDLQDFQIKGWEFD